MMRVIVGASAIADTHVEGAREHAFTLDACSLPWLEAALPVIARRSARLVIVGGGVPGTEAAAELARAYPTSRIVLLTRGEIAPVCSRGRVRSALHELGVELREHSDLETDADHIVAIRVVVNPDKLAALIGS